MGKKRRSVAAVAVARRCDGVYAPLGAKSRDKGGRLHDYTVWDMRGTPTIPPPIGRPRASPGSPLASGRDLMRPGCETGRTEAAGPRRRSSRGPFYRIGPRRPPAASAGRCGHVTPCIEPRRIIISVAVFGHRSIFYCDFFSPFRFQGGRVSHGGERCKLTSLRGCF